MTPDPTLSEFTVGGVKIHACTLDEAARRLTAGRTRGAVHLCNAYTISLASKDSRYADLLNRGDLNLADGWPVAWIGRRKGFKKMKARVYGPDLMAACLDQGQGSKTRHFLYGSTPEVLTALRRKIYDRWPQAEIVGMSSPPFSEYSTEDIERAVATFTGAGADLVWVGLGTPKQDNEVDRMASLGSATYIAIGAAFDFLAGSKRQAPKWIQRHGMEWAYRLATEPRRLWRRYLVGNTRFIWAALRDL